MRWRPIRTTWVRWDWPFPKPWKKPPRGADTNYALGSVLNHVALHQTIIGLEAKKQFEMAGDWPDVVLRPAVAAPVCRHGLPVYRRQRRRRPQPVRLVAVEPTSCPSLTKGQYAYDFGDSSVPRRS